jgi:cell division protein FtsB
MRILTLAMVALLVLIQYPLWLGKGGWLRVWDLEHQVALQQGVNERLLERNLSLEGEVKDLRDGTGAVEERARYELGMMRSDEIFVQLPDAVREGATENGGRSQAGTPGSKGDQQLASSR